MDDNIDFRVGYGFDLKKKIVLRKWGVVKVERERPMGIQRRAVEIAHTEKKSN